MPNWCENEIEIRCTGQNMSVLKQKIKSMGDDNPNQEQFLFKTLIGWDEGMTKERYENEWYDHNCNRFGTKWDVHFSDISSDIDEDLICLSFSTAWSPPLEFCNKLSKKYKAEVYIKYMESGMDYAGEAVFNEEGLEDNTNYGSYMEGLYNMDLEHFWLSIESEIEYSIESDSNFDDFKTKYYYLTQDETNKLRKMYEELSEK